MLCGCSLACVPASCVVVSEIMTRGWWWGLCVCVRRFPRLACLLSFHASSCPLHPLLITFIYTSLCNSLQPRPGSLRRSGPLFFFLFFSRRLPSKGGGDDTAVCWCKPLFDTLPKKKQEIVNQKKKNPENASFIITSRFKCSAVGEGKSNISATFLNTVTKTRIVLAGISLKRNIRITA